MTWKSRVCDNLSPWDPIERLFIISHVFLLYFSRNVIEKETRFFHSNRICLCTDLQSLIPDTNRPNPLFSSQNYSFVANLLQATTNSVSVRHVILGAMLCNFKFMLSELASYLKQWMPLKGRSTIQLYSLKV